MESETVKNEILERIRSSKPPFIPLPDVPIFPYSQNRLEDFVTHLLGFDGRAVKFKNREDALEWLKAQPQMDAKNNIVYSSLKEIEKSEPEEWYSDRKNAQKIMACATEGEMGVGEMGAIWVTDESLVSPMCALLSRWLFVLLDVNKIHGGLHEAYNKINLRNIQYGSFYTGPSATADIEAVHITGAQGPVALVTLLYNCEDAPNPPQVLVSSHADTSPWVEAELKGKKDLESL